MLCTLCQLDENVMSHSSVIGVFCVVTPVWLALPASTALGSTCYGTTSNGALAEACQLPEEGPNFAPYSSLGPLLGRTWAHCEVVKVVEESYAALEKSHPELSFVYGESGKKEGGSFEPHKTHQNGLSVDFMVPVTDSSGQSVPLPTSIENKFGYGLEFDINGKLDDLAIDFEAISAHIAAIKKAAETEGVGIWRVIFDPKLQPKLHGTKFWEEIKHLEFSTKQSWVRHDEHYHIDFEIPCEPLATKDS